MSKKRLGDFHRWKQKDIFPANLKQVSFGDTFSLFLGFLHDWSGRMKEKERASRVAGDLVQQVFDGPAVELDGSRSVAGGILTKWIVETQAKYSDRRPDANSRFLSLQPIHIDMARIWPSQYAKDNRVGLQNLFFSLLAFDENGMVDLGTLEEVRNFFSEDDPKKIGAFPRLILDSFRPAVSKDVESLRDENVAKMLEVVSAPFCMPHAQLFQEDMAMLMRYKEALAHTELVEWLYICICFHLATYTLRTANALKDTMEGVFRNLEASTTNTITEESSCSDCSGLGSCPYMPSIVAAVRSRIELSGVEPVVRSVREHHGIIVDHPVYLSTLSLLRETATISGIDDDMIAPHEFAQRYISDDEVRSSCDQTLEAIVTKYIGLDRISTVLAENTVEILKKRLKKNSSSALRVFKDAVSEYYSKVGSNNDSRQQVWRFYRAVTGPDGAGFMTQRSRTDFYMLSLNFITVMAHILLANTPSARISDFLVFLEKRGVRLSHTEGDDNLGKLVDNLQELGMYVKTSDDRAAQFLYPLYETKGDSQ